VADQMQSAPDVMFPHIADGAGYMTQFILLSAGASAGTTIRFYDEKGAPLPIGR
jgi:hypothetical protein